MIRGLGYSKFRQLDFLMPWVKKKRLPVGRRFLRETNRMNKIASITHRMPFCHQTTRNKKLFIF